MKCKRYATEEMISRLLEVDGVSGRSKPARDGRMKTSHFEMDVALGAANAMSQLNVSRQHSIAPAKADSNWMIYADKIVANSPPARGCWILHAMTAVFGRIENHSCAWSGVTSSR